MNKIDKDLLIQLVDDHLKAHGENISQVGLEKSQARSENVLNYRNLKKMGYLESNNGTTFWLLPEGYIKGMELKEPWGTLVRNHWQTVIPIALTVMAMIGGIIGFLISLAISSCTCPN
jgi:hypothetical protein